MSEENKEELNNKIENEEERQEDITVDKAIDAIKNVKKEVSSVKGKIQPFYEQIGEFCYECERAEQSLGGAEMNLSALPRTKPVDQPENLRRIVTTCNSFGYFIRQQGEMIEGWHKTVTNSSSLSSGAATILYNTASFYERNARQFNLPITPPTVEKEIDPYSGDQSKVEAELASLLRGIDPQLEGIYLGTKEIFKTPLRAKLPAASTEMRKLIWEILRKMAPHDKVAASPGFEQDPNKDPGVSTYRQRIAYIITGKADVNDSHSLLIHDIFNELMDALSKFSTEIKVLDQISNHQIITGMAKCERAILALLKNRKA